MLCVGLNPYGIAFTTGLYPVNTPRANPRPLGLDGYLKLAEELALKGIELPSVWLKALDADAMAKLHQRIQQNNWWVVLSVSLNEVEPLIPVARNLGAQVFRIALTKFLCGARAEKLVEWNETVAQVKKALPAAAKRAAEFELSIAIENHQDFDSDDLLELCELSGDNTGITLDCGNALSVGEDPLAFATKLARRVKHIHLKDYRAHWSDEGYRLIRCAIGEGAVAFKDIAKVFDATKLTASIEPGALNARHIRLLAADWWNGYRPRSATSLAAALFTARKNRMKEEEDWRTPWEADAGSDAIIAYEMQQLKKSVSNVKELGLL